MDQWGTIQFPEPTIQPSQVQPSGWGGKTEALAMFGDKFLEGLARGRALAFQRSEQQRARSIAGINSAIQAWQNADVPDQIKQQHLAPLLEAKTRLIAFGYGSQENKGKKGKATGSDAAEQRHPLHTIADAAKGFAERMLGPGAQKQPISPEDLSKITGDSYAQLKATPTIQQVNSRLDQSYGTVLSALQSAKGSELTKSEQMQHPALRQIAAVAEANNKGKPTETIQSFLDRGATLEQQQTPDYVAKVAEEQGRAAESRSREDYNREYAARYKTEAEGKEEMVQNGRGQTLVRRGTHFYLPGSEKPLPVGSPELQGTLSPESKTQQKPIIKVDTSGKLHMFDATGKDTVLPGKFDSPAQLQSAREAATDARAKARRDFGKSKAIATTRAAFQNERIRIASLDPDRVSKETKTQLLDGVRQAEQDYEDALSSEEEDATPPTNKPSAKVQKTLDRVLGK